MHAQSSSHAASLDAAANGRLRHVTDAAPGIARLRAGKGFVYRSPDGTLVRARQTLATHPHARDSAGVDRRLDLPRSRTATSRRPGRDARGRKQYRYHPRWREVARRDKFERLLGSARRCRASASASPRDLARAAAAAREACSRRSCGCSTTTLIRVGNDEYARENGSYGLTTLAQPPRRR